MRVSGNSGNLAAREGGAPGAGGPVYTDPDLAVTFCRETGIDALAPSFGTAHGIYKSKPVLDLERVKVIAEKTGLPLVMHGGSGVSDEDYRTAIRNGIRKINYYSYMSKAAVSASQEMLNTQDVTFWHDLALTAQQAMEDGNFTWDQTEDTYFLQIKNTGEASVDAHVKYGFPWPGYILTIAPGDTWELAVENAHHRPHTITFKNEEGTPCGTVEVWSNQ